jgi:hypothetical protein
MPTPRSHPCMQVMHDLVELTDLAIELRAEPIAAVLAGLVMGIEQERMNEYSRHCRRFFELPTRQDVIEAYLEMRLRRVAQPALPLDARD